MDDESFDKLCSVNTIYFWKEPEKYLSEIFRVIKSRGKIVIGFRDEKQMSNLNLSKDIFNTYSLDDVVNFPSDSGAPLKFKIVIHMIFVLFISKR